MTSLHDTVILKGPNFWDKNKCVHVKSFISQFHENIARCILKFERRPAWPFSGNTFSGPVYDKPTPSSRPKTHCLHAKLSAKAITITIISPPKFEVLVFFFIKVWAGWLKHSKLTSPEATASFSKILHCRIWFVSSSSSLIVLAIQHWELIKSWI